jgi:hypothetical protein
MQKWLVLVAEVREWLAGKKTYLLALLLVVTVLVLVYLGRLTPETALTVALVFAGLLSASFRSAIEQHHAEVLNLLIGISEAGADLRAGNKAGAVAVAKSMEPTAETLAAELNAERKVTA